jgi:hypothetical protein
MVEVKINAGICGFVTTIRADSEDLQMAELEIVTDCPNLKRLEKELKEVDAFKECFAKVGDGEIYNMCRKYGKHAACPVPCAIIKAVEVSCQLALPKNISMEITNVK